jgi:predicted transposase YdaD
MAASASSRHSDQSLTVEGAVRELLDAQQAYEVLRAAIEQPLANATLRREGAMHQAAELGLSRRRIAEMTGISHTRVIQILDAQPRRREIMRELAKLSGSQLADRLLALALSNSLSRDEMSEATGLSVDSVNELIRAHAEQRANVRNAAALEMVRRHMPNFGEQTL